MVGICRVPLCLDADTASSGYTPASKTKSFRAACSNTTGVSSGEPQWKTHCNALIKTIVLENKVLLRRPQTRLAGLQDNRTCLAAQRGKSKRHGSAPRHLRSALKSGYKSFSFFLLYGFGTICIQIVGFGYMYLFSWFWIQALARMHRQSGAPQRYVSTRFGVISVSVCNATSPTHVLQETISKQGDSDRSLL